MLPSGNSVFLVYGVRWFSTPLRLETMRTFRLPQFLRRFPFSLSQSPGQKFIVAGSATNSPISSCAITQHQQTWASYFTPTRLDQTAWSDVPAPLSIAEHVCTIHFIKANEFVLAIHRYFFTTLWSCGRSPDAFGVEGGR